MATTTTTGTAGAATGRRLSATARRAQLVAVGRRLVGERSFDEVTLDDLAEAAEVSRTLVFHYFANRSEFLAALVREFAGEMLDATAPTDPVDPIDGLRHGVESYLDFIAANRDTYLSMLRGASGGTPELQAVFAETRATQVDRILDGLGLTRDSADPLVVLAARSWVSLVEEAAVGLLEDPGVARDVLVERLANCLATLLGVDGSLLASLEG